MNTITLAQNWIDYELLDSGEGKKLERFGQYVVVRPDPRIIWKKTLPGSTWDRADATYEQDDERGEWKFRTLPPRPWEIGFGKLRFSLRATDFRHVGVFPEQASNWEWISTTLAQNSKKTNPVKILNLFAYTGGATMAAALAGAKVTHVDSSRPAMMWASENSKLAGIPKERVRWIQDDALKFVRREIRRGEKYDGIIMDPPRFGRGAKGEVWKLSENLPELLEACCQILADDSLFLLVNAYTADLAPLAVKQVVEDYTKQLGGGVEAGELGIPQSEGGRILPAGLFVRWSRGLK